LVRSCAYQAWAVPTITKNSAGNWKALVRRRGWPTTVKTFRRKRDAFDWARRVEDEMVRGVYVDRTAAERFTLRAAMARYLVLRQYLSALLRRGQMTTRSLGHAASRHSYRWWSPPTRGRATTFAVGEGR
jgi:hypothetical protein